MDVTYRVIRRANNSIDAVLVCATSLACLEGRDIQTTCPEMLHWDDYREEKGIKDGTGRMLDIFDCTKSIAIPVKKFMVDTQIVEPRSLAVSSFIAGTMTQMFCSEMQHWDDYRASQNICDTDGSMKALFGTKVRENEMTVWQPSTKQCKNLVIVSIASSRNTWNKDLQPLCTEMIHWDDYQRANAIVPNPKMEDLFGSQK